jgi:hypothetical protein
VSETPHSSSKSVLAEVKSDEQNFPTGTTLNSLREWVRPEAEQRDFTPDQAIGLAIRNWMNGQRVEIDEDQLEKLREYEALKGTSIEDAVNEAVAVWLECFASVRLESLQRRTANAGGSC